MNGLNIEWETRELDSSTHLAERIPHPSANLTGTVYRGTGSDLPAQAQIVEQILGRATPGWREASPEKGRQWAGLRQAASRGRAQLQHEDELRQNVGDDAPDISAANLHPWIWSGARSPWQSGHYVQAVRDAATKLNAETHNKVGRRDISETNLFKESFSLDEAKPEKARLRRLILEGSDTYRSVQRGAMAFAEGVFAGIRIPLSHEVD